MGGVLEDLLRLVREGLTPETLPEPPPEPAPTSRRPSLLRTLLAPEPLPEAPPASPRVRASALALLFGREPLAVEPVTPRTRHRWLAMIFSPERLDPPGGAGPEVH
jgi:hypothetical protein